MRDLSRELAERRRDHLYRSRRVAQSPQQPVMRIDGRQVISFCSNDYLGLANHPEVIAAFTAAARDSGVGAGAAHLINGHHERHHQLEQALAEFVGAERALLFSTGYMANLGILQALVGRGDIIYADRLNHASLIDGARLSGARLRRYPHGDTGALANLLSRDETGEKLIATDGVFSMDGDLADLPALFDLARQYDAWLLIDDAHGLGVLGQHGGGSLEHHRLRLDERIILMGTLGKAFGVSGAFVAGSETLIEYLIQKARTYIFTTAMPPALAAATLASLDLIRREPQRRQRLDDLIRHFRRRAREANIPLLPSQTAIQGIPRGENEAALTLSQHLWECGFLVTAIRPPTVPKGTARLRLTLSAAHRRGQIDALIESLGEGGC